MRIVDNHFTRLMSGDTYIIIRSVVPDYVTCILEPAVYYWSSILSVILVPRFAQAKVPVSSDRTSAPLLCRCQFHSAETPTLSAKREGLCQRSDTTERIHSTFNDSSCHVSRALFVYQHSLQSLGELCVLRRQLISQ